MSDRENVLPVTGVILAGGKGRRMNGQDKGLIKVKERPLIEYVLDALTPQVNELIINANRHIPAYEDYGYRVLSDEMADFQGPLAGMLTGLSHASNERVVFVPCDTTSLPVDLVRRLVDAMDNNFAEIAVAHDGDRMHPVYAMLSKSCMPSLKSYLDSGQRKADTWMERNNAALVDFSDIPDAFLNFNTQEQINSAR